jgi:Amt family ammonium transporter
MMVTFVKERFGYDDALDTFGCHGMGGLVGTLLTGVFADPRVWRAFGGSYAGALYGNPRQLLLQALGAGIAIAVGFGGTFAILKLVDGTIGLRVGEKEEAIGLDIALHHERAYTVLE